MAKEAMGKSARDKLTNGIGCADVRIIFEYVIKHSEWNVRFE